MEKWYQHGKIDLFETHTSQAIVFLGVCPCLFIVISSKPKTINLLKTQNPEV
jgi:hypothetical protein